MTAGLRKNIQGWYLVLPAFILVTLILFLPTADTIRLSFTRYSPAAGAKAAYIGLGNYLAVFGDEEFLSSLTNTFVFTAVTVAFEVLFGFFLALAVNRAFAYRGLLRTAILFPWVLPTALNAVIWRWLFNTDFGFFNALLRSLGLTAGNVNWLGDIPLAMASMMFVAVWKTSSFIALIVLTGLQTIPQEIYDASGIDGASKGQQLRLITLPLLVPSILLALLFRSMDAFRVFELPFSLTQGGPAGTTQTLSLYGYRQFFQFLKFDIGSTVSFVQFFIIFCLGMLYVKVLRGAKE